MKYGIFSDIHGNVEAFNAVLDFLKKEQVDQYVFAGDIVGYGAEPKECIRILRSLISEQGCQCVAGNHDYAVCGKSADDNYTRHAKEAVEWTRKHIGEEEMEFLRSLPLIGKTDHFYYVHASLETPQQWNYIFDIDDANPNFALLQKQVCFIGHSHKPIVFTSGESVDWFKGDQIVLKDEVRYIINIGSVGQPRDGNPRSSFAVYDTESKTVDIQRVEYDIAATQKKILDGGLPKILADRLSLGK